MRLAQNTRASGATRVEYTQHNKFKYTKLTESNDGYQYNASNLSEYAYIIIQLNRNGQVLQKKGINIDNGGRFTIGNSQKCDMCIEDNSIDELQSIISKDNKGMFLINNSMLCKLYYDRKSVRQVDIADGTLIFLGNYIYKFREVRHESKIQTVE
ncbi:hypothetical protein H7U36_14330 [Faecalicatena fissicatena]|uniref:FHA domain-containing protein n=1 Tax=Faecalicatena fissicatena TaxID=290055 RepID=A0ABS2ECA0_9FIRM|nr:hypothetical protein [Faecalicatena fissicatena]